MSQQQPQQLARLLSVTVYPPGERPKRFVEDQIIAAGMQGGTPLVVVRGEEGEQVEYFGMPLKIVKAPPSGLVSPGGLRIA